MYRQYLLQLKLLEGKVNEAVIQEEGNDGSESEESSTESSERKRPMRPLKVEVKWVSKPGTLVPPHALPCTPAIIGDINKISDTPSTKTLRVFISGIRKNDSLESLAVTTALTSMKTLSSEKGFEFHVINLGTWEGYPYITPEIVRKSILGCRKYSAGLSCMLFLGHDEDKVPVLHNVDEKVFKTIYESSAVTSEAKSLIEKWYRKDENAIPVVYTLLLLHEVYPDVIEKDRDDHDLAVKECMAERTRASEAIAKAAKDVLPSEERAKYTQSGFETEVDEGIFSSSGPTDHCLCFIKNQQESPSDLISRIKESLGEKNVHAYNTESTEEAEEMFEKVLNSTLLKSIELQSTKPHVDDALHMECLHHSQICRKKLKGFQGREDILKKIKDYVQSSESHPLILHGQPGCGKTSIVAAAVKEAPAWIKGKGAVIVRIINRTNDTSRPQPLIHSILQQVYRSMNVFIEPFYESLEKSIKFFGEVAELIKKKKLGKYVIFLDGIDNLHEEDDRGHVLSWFPSKVSPSFRIIMSTSVPSSRLESHPVMKGTLGAASCLPVPELDPDFALHLVDSWLNYRNRKLTERQHAKLKEALSSCTNPLYLRLILNVICRWTSFERVENEVLGSTIEEAFKTTLDKVERKHGCLVVSKMLSYITAAQQGLQGSELGDILSSDKDFMNDVVDDEESSSIQRMQMKILAVKSDLQYILVEGISGGFVTIDWEHNIFKDFAKERYLSNSSFSKEIQSSIGRYYSERLKQGAVTPYHNGLRHLPFHLIQFENIEELKKECLYNVDFLSKKLQHFHVHDIMEDYSAARMLAPLDEQLRLMSNFFSLSADALIVNQEELISQLKLRMSGDKLGTDLLNQTQGYNKPHLVSTPGTQCPPPGQHYQLLYSLYNSDLKVLSLHRSQNGLQAVTGSLSSSQVCVWDIERGHLLRTLSGVHNEVVNHVVCAQGGKMVIVNCLKRTYALTELGDSVYHIVHDHGIPIVGFCGEDNSTMVMISDDTTNVYSTVDGSLQFSMDTIKEVCVDASLLWMTKTTKNYVVFAMICDKSQFAYFNVKERKFSSVITVEGEMSSFVITPDESFIIIIEEDDNVVLHFYDVKTMEKTKKMEFSTTLDYREDEYEGNAEITIDGQYLYYANLRQVQLLNLKTGDTEILIEHPADIKMVKTLDGDKWVTISGNLLNVWMRETNRQPVEHTDAVQTLPIYEVHPLQNTRYVVLTRCGYNDEEGFVIQVYDLLTRTVVRQGQSEFPLNYSLLLDDNHLLVVDKYKRMLKIDMDTMQVVLEFEDRHKAVVYEEEGRCVALVNEGKEIAMHSKHQRKLLIIDVSTGKRVIKIAPEMKKPFIMRDLATNKKGNICAVSAYVRYFEDRGAFVYDIPNRQFLFFVNLHYSQPDVCYTSVSSSGRYVFMHDQGYLLDLQGELTRMLITDEEYSTHYKPLRKKVPSYAEEREMTKTMGVLIDDDYFFAAEEDGIIRIFDLKSHEITRKTGYHSIPDDLDLFYVDGGPFVVTFDPSSSTYRVWRKGSWEDLGSLKVDKEIMTEMLSDGRSFLAVTDEEVHHVTVANADVDVDLSKEPEIFERKGDWEKTLDLGDLKYWQKAKDDEEEEVKKDEEESVASTLINSSSESDYDSSDSYDSYC